MSNTPYGNLINYHTSDICKVDLQYYDSMVWMHCEVYKDTPSTIKAIRDGIPILIQKLGREGYKEVFAFTQNPKFCKMVGGDYVSSFDEDGEHFDVFHWK